MALLPYPDRESLPADVKSIVTHFENEHGRPSLLRLILAQFPAGLGALDGLYHPVMENGHLPRRLKEILFVVSAHARGCFYCTGGHSRFLVHEFGFGQDQVVALREPGRSAEFLTVAEQSAVDYVRKISREPYRTVSADVHALREHGYSSAEILEMTVVAAVAGFTTTVASAMHLEDDLNQFGMEGYF